MNDKKFRAAKYYDLINPASLTPFYVTIKSLGLDRVMCFNAGMIEHIGMVFYIMRIRRDDWSSFIKNDTDGRVFAVQVLCRIDEIEVLVS